MRIAVLVYDRISPILLSAPLAVFGNDFVALGHHVTVCQAEPGPLAASGGLWLMADGTLQDAEAADLVILPGWRDAAEPAPEALLIALQQAAARGATVVGLCLGSFVLAEAGLLADRRATTHWARADLFRGRFPQVALDERAIFIDEGAIVTSAGAAAGLDCCLHLLARIEGPAVANAAARLLVSAPVRQGGQAQFIDRPLPQRPADLRLAAVLDWMAAHPDQPARIGDLAARAGMSRRSFTRHFRTQTGGTVQGWQRDNRIAHAKTLLERGLSVEEVAWRCGFAAASAFRTAFVAATGLSPAAWRKRFLLASVPPE